MFFNSIASLWKEATQFFLWENLKILILVVLNTFIRTVRLVVKKLWWLFFVILMAQYFNFTCIYYLLTTLLLFLMILLVRPSVGLKNKEYFFRCAKYFFGYLVVLFFVGFLFVFYQKGFFVFHLPINYLRQFFYVPLSFVIIPTFFCLDGRGSLVNVFNSIFKSLKFLVLFFPITGLILLWEILAIYLFVDFLSLRSTPGIDFVQYYSQAKWIFLFFIRYLFLLLYASFLSVIYIKIKYNHYKLFFV
jgi:hypothetical protein